MLVDLRAYLLDELENVIDDRVYPGEIPQGSSFPAITYNLISEQRLLTMQGPTSAVAKRMQIDAWATTFGAAWELAEAIRVALDGFRGTMGDTEIQGIECSSSNPTAPEPDTKLKRVSRDFIIWHRE